MKNDNDVLLSISILMSGRKETRQCLESLVPLMEQVPSELILVDTGCDEETRKILEEYTDIIIPFEWCDDFAKARNVGLERATGKWFMYLDDDEWFVDTSEIIDFFNSGEYKKYKSASYKTRNYTRLDEMDYIDNYATRMTKIFDNTTFIHSIHEGLSPLLGPVKLFDVHVKHFGYVYETQEDMFKDSNRNLNLLKKEVKNNPDDLRMGVLILQEYRRLNEFDNIIECALEYIDKINRDGSIDNDFEWKLCAFYCYILEAYERKQDYKQELKYLDKICDDKRVNELTKAFFYKSELTACNHLKDYERAFLAFENYIRLYDDLADNEEVLYLQGRGLNDGVFRENTYKYVISNGIMVALKLGREDILEKYFDELEWTDMDVIINPVFVKELMVYILDNEYNQKYTYYIDKMLENDICVRSIVNYVSSLENTRENLDSKRNDVEINELESKEGIEDKNIKFERAIKLLSQINNKHWYFTYMRVLNYNNTKDIIKCEKDLEKLFSCVVDVFNLDNKLWNIIEETNVDFNKLINNISFEKWQMGLNSWITNADEEDIKYKEELIGKWKVYDNYKYLYFDMKVAEYYIRQVNKNDNIEDNIENNKEVNSKVNVSSNNNDKDKEITKEISLEQLEERLFTYADLVYNFYSKIYNQQVFMNHREVLPQDCILSIELRKVNELRNKDENKKVLENLKELIDIYDPFNDIIKLYGQKLGEFIKDNLEKNSVNEEMIQLSIALKGKAREFIENGDEVQAKRILKQIIMYVPDDKEAKEILMMLE